jgi:hypothetical protein
VRAAALTRRACLTFALLLLLAGCRTEGQSRWQEGYEDGCLHARSATKEQCEARASEVEGLDEAYRSGWIEGYQACRFGPEGC